MENELEATQTVGWTGTDVTVTDEPRVEGDSLLTGKYVRPTVGDLPGRKSQLDFEPFGVGIPSGVWVRLPLK